jgi:hypothetical protein
MLLLDQPFYCPELAPKNFHLSSHCKATPEINVLLVMRRLQMRHTAAVARTAANAELQLCFLETLW